MPYPIVNPLGSIHYTSKISVPSLYWCSGYELPVFPSLDDIYCIDNEINCMFLVCLKFYIWYHDFISLKYFTLLRYFILLKHFSLLKFSDFTPLKYFSVLKYFFKMKYLYSVKCLMVLTYLHISFCPLTVQGQLKQGRIHGYRVACGWAGAIFEVTWPFGQEQWGKKKIIKKMECDRPTDWRTKRGARD